MPDSGTAPSPSEGAPTAPAGPDSPLVVDETRREAYCRGRQLDLSPTEFALLACLHQRAGETVTYEALLREVWGTPLEQGGSLAQVRSTVARLRKKLAAAGAQACRIASVRSTGYRLDLSSVERKANPSRRPIALRIAPVLAVAVLLAGLASGWLFAERVPGRPTTPVWYRGQRVPIALLWALQRGQHCCAAPDGELYCFDTPEERAAALDVLLRSAEPQGQDQYPQPDTTPESQP